jgi:hypothetical protein
MRKAVVTVHIYYDSQGIDKLLEAEEKPNDVSYLTLHSLLLADTVTDTLSGLDTAWDIDVAIEDIDE